LALTSAIVGSSFILAVWRIDVKNIQIKIKKRQKRANMTKIKKTFVNVEYALQ